jgi:hypothetical protein
LSIQHVGFRVNQSGIKPQYNVYVTVPLGIQLKRIRAFSPDGTSTVELPVQYKDTSISCTIDTLRYYTILSLEYGDVAVFKKPTSKINAGFSDNHKAHPVVNLQGKQIRSTDAGNSHFQSSLSSGVYVGGTQKKRSVVNR